MLRTIYCATGAPAYNTWSKNTTTKTTAKLGNKMRQTSGTSALRRARALFQRVCSLRYQCESRGRGPARALYVFNQSAEPIALWKADTHGSIKNLFGDFDHSIQQRAAAGQDDPARQLAIPSGVTDFVRHVHQ